MSHYDENGVRHRPSHLGQHSTTPEPLPRRVDRDGAFRIRRKRGSVTTAPRYAEGIDGPILLAAWCPTCRCEAMPMRNQTCGFCDTRLVLPEQDTNGDAKPLPSRPPRGRRPHPSVSRSGSTRYGPKPITEASILDDLRAVTLQLGRTPYKREWERAGWSPCARTVLRRFGSWDSALVAAGLKETA